MDGKERGQKEGMKEGGGWGREDRKEESRCPVGRMGPRQGKSRAEKALTLRRAWGQEHLFEKNSLKPRPGGRTKGRGV